MRMIRLWFTDVLGQLKSFAISPVELEGAFEEGMRFDGSSIDGFSRVQESDVLAKPDPNSFEILPWADGVGTSARVFCDIVNLDGSPFEGDPRQVLRRNLEQGPRQGVQLLRRPRDGVLLLRRQRPGAAAPPARPGVVLRPDDGRRRHRPAPAHHPHARGDGHPGRVQPPRGRAQPARDRPALHRRAHDGRQRDDLPPGGEGGGARGRRARHVHAQAAHRRAGLGHAHPLLALRGRHQRVLRSRRRAQPVEGGPRLHRRPAAPRQRDHRGHQPVGQLLQAAGRGLRGADLQRRGPATTGR